MVMSLAEARARGFELVGLAKKHGANPAKIAEKVEAPSSLSGRCGMACWASLTPETDWEPVELEELWHTLYKASRGVELAQVRSIRSSPENRPATSWMLRVGREIYEFESMSHAIIAEVVKERRLHAFNPRDLWTSDRFLKGAKDSANGHV